MLVHLVGLTEPLFLLVLLGIPFATVTLGDAALPSVSLVVFNPLTPGSLVTISVEWARLPRSRCPSR